MRKAQSNRGRPFSEAHKLAIREGARRRAETPEGRAALQKMIDARWSVPLWVRDAGLADVFLREMAKGDEFSAAALCREVKAAMARPKPVRDGDALTRPCGPLSPAGAGEGEGAG